MIYFDKPTREILTEKYYHSLESGGYLVLGLSETLLDVQTDFRAVLPSVYKKP